jgi:hypothetical protein
MWPILPQARPGQHLHFGVLAGPQPCCRAGQGLIAIVMAEMRGTWMGLPGVLVAVLRPPGPVRRVNGMWRRRV